MKLVCPECGYKFDADKNATRCPYCGKNGGFSKEKSAAEMIEDA